MPYFITEDHCRIFYEDKGVGQPVVFVHGWGCNRHYFKHQVRALKDSYRVITLDLRGHGDSERSERTEYSLNIHRLAQDLYELTEYLELKDMVLAGWSMGAQVLYDYVRSYGCGNVKKLCLIDMSPKIMNDDSWKLGQACSLDHQGNLDFAVLAASDWNQAAELFIPLMFAGGRCKDEEMLQWALKNAKENTPHCMVNLILSLSYQDYRDVLERITVPVLLVHGRESVLYGVKHGEYLHSVLPTSTLEIIPDSGHALFLEQPELFNRAFLQFLTA